MVNELKPWFGEPPHATAPELPGYRQVSHEQLNITKITVIGTLLIPFWAIALVAIVAMLGGPNGYDVNVSLTTLVLFVFAVIATILVHELIHGLVAATLGARPAFGVGPGFAYTTFLDPMSKAGYLAVGIAPLLLFSVATVAAAVIWPATAGWMIAIATINASGAIGDLWMTVQIMRAPKHAKFYDLADGFAVYAPSNGS